MGTDPAPGTCSMCRFHGISDVLSISFTDLAQIASHLAYGTRTRMATIRSDLPTGDIEFWSSI